MASSGLAAWITPRWVVVVTTCMGGPCGPRVGGVADPLIMATDLVGWTMRLLWERWEMVTSSKSLACWVTVGPGVRGMGFVWGVRDREVGVVREAHQGGEEGVGCVGRVILLDCEGQGERH